MHIHPRAAVGALALIAFIFPFSAHAGDMEPLSGSVGIPLSDLKGGFGQPTPEPARIVLDVEAEFGQRQLQSFHDTAISRSAGNRHFYNGQQTLDTRAVTIGATITRPAIYGLPQPVRWRLEARYFEGDATDQQDIFIQSGTTDTISIDGVQAQPSIFSISSYDTTVTVEERGGEAVLLGEFIRRNSARSSFAVSVGPKIGYRHQSWDVDYLGTYQGTNAALLGAQAVHYIREELEIPYVGVAGRLEWQAPITPTFHADLSLDASAYGQFISLSANDCFSIRFGAPVCDGFHHGRGAFEYRGRVDADETALGAQLRVAGKLTKTFQFGSFEGAIHGGGYIEGTFNDVGLDNPTFFDRHAARVKYDNVFGYGLKFGGSLKF